MKVTFLCFDYYSKINYNLENDLLEYLTKSKNTAI